MTRTKKLAAAALLGAALVAAPEPAEAQSGCELLYLKWEGCATECDSYYESTVLRAVCRGWCLVEYLYDYWTCESNVEGAGTEEEAATDEDESGEEPPAEPPAADESAALFRRGGSLRAPATRPPVGETSPAILPGARRAVFRRAALRPCAVDSAPLRRVVPGRPPAGAALPPRGSNRDAGPGPMARRGVTAAGKK